MNTRNGGTGGHLRLIAPKAPRSLHLIDVENLLGGTAFTEADVAATAVAYATIASMAAGDLIVLASSHFTAAAAWFGWPASARRLARSGIDGADLALLDVLRTENVERRFERVVIASGDHIFAGAAMQLIRQGVEVTIVTRLRALAQELALAVHDIRYFDDGPTLLPDISKRVA